MHYDLMIAVKFVNGTNSNTWIVHGTSVLGTNCLAAAEAAFIGWMSDVLAAAHICVWLDFLVVLPWLWECDKRSSLGVSVQLCFHNLPELCDVYANQAVYSPRERG